MQQLEEGGGAAAKLGPQDVGVAIRMGVAVLLLRHARVQPRMLACLRRFPDAQGCHPRARWCAAHKVPRSSPAHLLREARSLEAAPHHLLHLRLQPSERRVVPGRELPAQADNARQDRTGQDSQTGGRQAQTRVSA
jgi:hypothetical protein